LVSPEQPEGTNPLYFGLQVVRSRPEQGFDLKWVGLDHPDFTSPEVAGS
jgi:hypothetical protein